MAEGVIATFLGRCYTAATSKWKRLKHGVTELELALAEGHPILAPAPTFPARLQNRNRDAQRLDHLAHTDAARHEGCHEDIVNAE